METTDKYVGLDVHSDQTAIAIVEGGREGEVRSYDVVTGDPAELDKVLRKLGRETVRLRARSEAGPTGYVIYRQLLQLKIACVVVAPSEILLPSRHGQKTDRRGALRLAWLRRAGQQVAIAVPDAIDESMRDLTRAVADEVDDLRRAKQRLKSFLLRRGYRYGGTRTRTKRISVTYGKWCSRCRR